MVSCKFRVVSRHGGAVAADMRIMEGGSWDAAGVRRMGCRMGMSSPFHSPFHRGALGKGRLSQMCVCSAGQRGEVVGRCMW